MKKNDPKQWHHRCHMLRKMLNIMKLTTLLFFLALFQVSAISYSQQKRLNLKFQNESLESVFSKIEANSEFSIFYKDELIQHSKEQSGEFKDALISEILNQVLESENLSYTVKDKLIVIVPKEEGKLELNTQQEKSVSGKVTDSSGTSLPGVSIILKGTTKGTISDANGIYSLSNVSVSTILQFSFVGMKTIEMQVGNKSTINVQMVDETTGIEEVVAIGYGSQRKASLTGAVANVSGKEVASLPVVSLSQALQGKVAGVSVTNNGSPGSSPVIQIRGIGTINFSTNPLYVVDGIPTNSINNLSPADIESMDILKDASATAIYGSRGSNGVIIVTTKQAQSEKFQITYEGYSGVQTAWKQLPLMNTNEYLTYGKMMNDNAGLPYPARWSKMDEPIYPGATQTWAQTNTDWQDAMFRSANIQQHSVALTGGNAKSKFYTSAAYFKQDGIMIGTYYNRLNFRLNSNHEISKTLKFGQTLNISQDANQGEQQVGARPQILNMQRMLPYMPLHDPTRDGGFRSPDGADGTDPDNPVRAALLGSRVYHSFRMVGSAFAEVKILDYLKYKSSVGLDYTNDRFLEISPTWNEGTFHSSPQAGVDDSRGTGASWLFTNQLTFDRTIGKHYINATAVAEQTKSKYFGLSGSGGFPDNSLQVLQGPIPSTITISSSEDEESLLSYIARIQYSYANKYLFSASWRADGSSKFAPGNKWGYFKSFSAGWRVKEESFLKDVDAISDLKLRASYGETGFNGIGNYVWQTNLQAGGTFYNFVGSDMQGSFFNQLGNTNLKWETTNMTNFGLDLKFLDNALSLTAEYYDRETTDMLLQVAPAPSMGYWNSTYTNIGKMSNKGFELTLGYNKQLGDLLLNVSGNISSNKNEVVKLDLPTAQIFAGNADDYGFNYPITVTQEGYPIQQFYGFRVDHILQAGDAHPTMPNAKPGDMLFKDISGPDGKPDGIVDDKDREILGSFLPKFNYGFNLSATYKGFDFTAFLQGSYGNKIFNANRIITTGMIRLFNASPKVLNAWTPSNTNSGLPRAIAGDPNQNARVSDRWLEDGSFARIKTVTLGYTLPKLILNDATKGICQNVRIYFTAQNLLTFTKYTGYDPEVGQRSAGGNYTATYGALTQGVDYGQFPQPRTFLGGLQVTF
jgi:TonB-linked SusC/RagA family outer membrane protein